jgi:hypothetical protein
LNGRGIDSSKKLRDRKTDATKGDKRMNSSCTTIRRRGGKEQVGRLSRSRAQDASEGRSNQVPLIVQLPNEGDPTSDPSLVWPDDRRTIAVGTISITSVVADSNAAERALVFFPTTLTDGIELSDDPFPALRTSVYALSFAHRQQK